jgi:CHAD domain-containing protein
MHERLTSAARRKLERRLTEVDGQLRHAEDQTAWIAPLGLRIARRAGRVEKTVDSAGAVYAQERVHAVRIAVKQLRYALELAHETGLARVARAIRTTRAVQDTLGRLHDLEMLQTETAEVVAMTPADAEWTAEVAHLGHDLERQCRELHGRYVRRRPALLDVCQTAHVVAEKILKGPRRVERGRALKMTLPRVSRRTRRTAIGRV